MSTTTIFTCDECMKIINPDDIGTKIVIGCVVLDQLSALLYYCSSCQVPTPKEIARAKPWHIIQEIVEETVNGKVPRWLGRIYYNPDLEAFTDGYGDEPLI